MQKQDLIHLTEEKQHFHFAVAGRSGLSLKQQIKFRSLSAFKCSLTLKAKSTRKSREQISGKPPLQTAPLEKPKTTEKCSYITKHSAVVKMNLD